MRLGDLASLIRSKNAGPFMITIDIFFPDAEAFNTALSSGILEKCNVAAIYDVAPDDIMYFELPETLSVKISFPRHAPSGSIADDDLYGCQFMARLAAQELPARAAT